MSKLTSSLGEVISNSREQRQQIAEHDEEVKTLHERLQKVEEGHEEQKQEALNAQNERGRKGSRFRTSSGGSTDGGSGPRSRSFLPRLVVSHTKTKK